MCDFHSICVRVDGAKAHIPSNSHSGAVKHFQWTENDRMADMRGPRFLECEWDGAGKFPGVDAITRGGAPNEKQAKAIALHYEALRAVLDDPATHAENMCLGSGIFAKDEYADVRWKVLIDPRCPKRVADRLAVMPLYAGGETIKSFHPKIAEISGKFCIAEDCKITAPVLAKSGHVVVQQGATFTAPALAEVSGYVVVRQGATFTAPALAKSGSVNVQQGATFTAPVLAEVSDSVNVQQGATFTAPVLAEVSGYVVVRQGATFTAPVLAKSGYVVVRQGATFTAPVLAKSGHVDVQQGATFTAPVLAEVSDSVNVQQGATFTAPVLAEVSGYVDVQQGGKLDAPKLKRRK